MFAQYVMHGKVKSQTNLKAMPELAMVAFFTDTFSSLYW